jgi:hypothetical protein
MIAVTSGGLVKDGDARGHYAVHGDHVTGHYEHHAVPRQPAPCSSGAAAKDRTARTAPAALTAAGRRRGSQVKHAIVRADVFDFSNGCG